MPRVVIIGNSGGGKSVLARRVSSQLGCPYVEIDAVLWQPGWRLAPVETYEAEHTRLISEEHWVIDGLGRRESVPQRLERATDIVLIDMPLWMHFSLAAERQIQWASGVIENPPAGEPKPPPTKALFRTIWDVDQTWMPEIRSRVATDEARGKRVFRVASVSELDKFSFP
jgi:adenylate kinase family enzyme